MKSAFFSNTFCPKLFFLDYTIRIPANFDVSEFLTRLMVSVCVCFAFVYILQKRETQMEGKLDSEPKKLSRRKDWICSKRQRAHPGKHDFFCGAQPVWKITSQCTKVVFANDFTSYLYAGTPLRKFERGFRPQDIQSWTPRRADKKWVSYVVIEQVWRWSDRRWTKRSKTTESH